MAVVILGLWGLMLLWLFSLICNHQNGCLGCECLRDDPPHLSEVIYEAGNTTPKSKAKIENMYLNQNFRDKNGKIVPKHMHQDYYKGNSFRK
jgi:hypothetical protein